MGKDITRLETLLPREATVRLVKADAEEGVVEIAVRLPASTPAMALHNVARAIELVTVGPGGPPAENPIGDLRQAKVKRVGDAPGYRFETITD